MTTLKHILISRTDAIGDVILTLPMVGYLKTQFPEYKISFIGRSYTQHIIENSTFVDEFINWDDFENKPLIEQSKQLQAVHADYIIHVFPNKAIAKAAKIAGIKNRIGTSHRSFHFFTCNYRLKFSRKKSDLHEAQLNFKLLAPLGIDFIPNRNELPQYYGYPTNPIACPTVDQYIDNNKTTIILHPRSKGSAREWGLENFGKLIDSLDKSKFQILISGTKQDGDSMTNFLDEYKLKAQNLTGKLSLSEYIALISKSQALIAASTGPLHIAAALGIKAIGLYAPMRPIHEGRWGPIGKKAKGLYIEKKCSDCKKTMECACIKSITPPMVINAIEN